MNWSKSLTRILQSVLKTMQNLTVSLCHISLEQTIKAKLRTHHQLEMLQLWIYVPDVQPSTFSGETNSEFSGSNAQIKCSQLYNVFICCNFHQLFSQNLNNHCLLQIRGHFHYKCLIELLPLNQTACLKIKTTRGTSIVMVHQSDAAINQKFHLQEIQKLFNLVENGSTWYSLRRFFSLQWPDLIPTTITGVHFYITDSMLPRLSIDNARYVKLKLDSRIADV